jgi:SAM-dependent methyltransferase
LATAESAVAAAEDIYRMLEEELDAPSSCLPPPEAAEMRKYYGRLLQRPRMRAFCRYNWLQRVLPAAELVHAGAVAGAVKVLDAGCGCGTESLLWASLGETVEVLGVDPHPVRLAAARHRLAECGERLGRALNVDFASEDAFDVLDGRKYDLIWVMEAISHIHPAETFLDRAAASLEPGGHLIVTDSNLLNPAMAWKVLRLRWRGDTGETFVTEDGKQVHSEPEHLFGAGRMVRAVRRRGLEVQQAKMSVFFPPALSARPGLFRLARTWDRMAGALPLLNRMGGIYTVVGRKA